MTQLKARIDGQWVPLLGGGGGGTDEVYIGPDDPIAATPTIELWYDTDAAAIMTDEQRWNTAWGVVAKGTWVVNGSVAAATGTVLANMPAFTPQVGRRYRFTFHIRAMQAVSGDGAVSIGVQRNGAGFYESWHQISALGSMYDNRTVVYPFDGDGVASTWQIKVTAASGWGITVWTDGASSWTLEDVGPVVGAVPAPNPIPAWTNFTFTAGSSPAGWLPLRYRRLGDVVTMEGMVQTTAANQIIGTLPEGFRPTGTREFPVSCFDGVGRKASIFIVYGDGRVLVESMQNNFIMSSFAVS